jgi:hypothetical protein
MLGKNDRYLKLITHQLYVAKEYISKNFKILRLFVSSQYSLLFKTATLFYMPNMLCHISDRLLYKLQPIRGSPRSALAKGGKWQTILLG